MENRLIKSNISSEAIGAIFIVVFVSLFILANLTIGFVWPLYILAMTIGFTLSIVYPKSGLFAIVFLTMVFERFFALQTFFIGKIEYKIYPLDILMIGIMIGIFVQYLFIKRIKLKKIDWVLISFIFLNAIYFITSAFIFKSDANLAFSSLKNYGFYSLFYFITLFLIRGEDDLKRLFKFFLAGGIAIVAFIIFGLLNGEGLWSQFTPLSTTGVRTLAFTHGLYITLALFPVILYLIFTKNRNKWLYVLAAIWIIGIVGTMMRHLWIAIAGMFVVLYILLAKEKKAELRKVVLWFAIPLLAISVFVLYAVFMSPQSSLSVFMGNTFGAVSQRATSLASVSADESFAWRSLVWKNAYEKFKANPIFGIGTGQKIYVESEDYKDFIEIRNIHNSYLAILIQLGFAGFGIFLYFVVKSVKNLIKSNGDSRHDFYKFSILSALGIYIISIPFQPYLETNLLAIFFWIALGLARALPEIKFTQSNIRHGGSAKPNLTG